MSASTAEKEGIEILKNTGFADEANEYEAQLEGQARYLRKTIFWEGAPSSRANPARFPEVFERYKRENIRKMQQVRDEDYKVLREVDINKLIEVTDKDLVNAKGEDERRQLEGIRDFLSRSRPY